MPNGAALWAWDTGGTGPVIVLVHPLSGNHASWAYQQPVFAAAGYRVVGYSRRGFYRSARGPADDLGGQAEDLALLLDAIGVGRCHLVGTAAGGATALDFVLTYPERALAAVIASSFMSIDAPDYQALLARVRAPWFDGLPPEAKELSPSFRAFDPDGMAEWLRIHDLNGFGPDAPPVWQPTTARIDWSTLAANRVPILLLTGGADLFMPPALLRWLAPRIGAAEIAIAPEAGHPLFAEAPAAFNEIVLGFFGG